MPERHRPFFNERGANLLTIFEDSSIELEVVAEIAYELQFRRTVSRQRKAEVVERLIELIPLATDEGGPGFEFPEIDLSTTRATNRRTTGDRSWWETGILKLSGYSVGRTNGIPEADRRRILNYLFLRDELADVDDASYAAQWGEPMSPARLERMALSIAGLASQANRRQANMNQAIDEWSADLSYLKSQFYDDWGGFPWPDLDVD